MRPAWNAVSGPAVDLVWRRVVAVRHACFRRRVASEHSAEPADRHGDDEAREANYAMGQIEYPPMHKDYAAVLKHLGGLAPGQSKGVPPWPDQ
jgi:hypothetical protein